MSKSKKLFSIALAVLLALQLLLIPTFAEGETATGKYTTADNLPLIYGAGESLEGFESCESFTDQKSGTYNKVILGDYYGTKYSLNTETDYVSEGTKSFKVNPEQSMFKFFIDLRTGGTTKKYENITFYVDFPAGTVEDTTSKGDAAKYPDGKYGIGLGLTGGVGVWDNLPTLSNVTVTYYFKDGSKLTKTENGIYPYNKDGSISTTGFEGYVSVALKESDYQDSTKYLMLYTYSAEYKENLFKKAVYFDDFRCVDYNNFVPYAYQDFEALTGDTVIQGNWQMPYKVFCTDVAKTDNTSENVSYSVDANGIAQGKNSMKIAINGTRGNFRMAIGLTKTGSPFNTTDYNGVAFYVSIPAGQNSKIEVALYNKYEWGTKKSLNAVYTYWFEDGSVLVKYGDDGIYPYDKNGNKSANGFNGYVSVYYGDCSLTDYPYLQLRGDDWNSSLQNKSIYIDDIRPCNFNVVEDIVSGDAYYVNNAAIPVQKVGDTAVLSVMTNLAKLGMARNADGIEALRNVMLGYTTAADKHNVNGIDGTDIRDLVALYKLSAS
ncbi:MAG: hypothetical protein U0L84_04660 [Acutalibacteraceae bacterium]|nr:hypothetical protein [Acutalibacteraceae bacterium]